MSFEKKIDASLARIRDDLVRVTDELSAMARAREVSEFYLTAEQELALRRRRDEVFDARMFGEPAWDILLDLYTSQCKGEVLTVSAVCIGAAVPSTTALRYIEMLVQLELIARDPHATDGRIIHLRLTEAGKAKIELVFNRAVDGGRSRSPQPRPDRP